MAGINGISTRFDLQIVADMVEPGTRVLDVGCGEGELLKYLDEKKKVDGRGIELSMQGVRAAVSHGLSVIQGDADTDLKDYPSGAFDYVILSQTLQATRRPKEVLSHMLRIGRHAIVSFPNFGHWRIRFQMAFMGRMPVTDTLGYQWFDTPNIHLCTIADFMELCRSSGIKVEKAISLDSKGNPSRLETSLGLHNLLGEQGVFLLKSS